MSNKKPQDLGSVLKRTAKMLLAEDTSYRADAGLAKLEVAAEFLRKHLDKEGS